MVFSVTGNRAVWTLGPEYFLIEENRDSHDDGGTATVQSSCEDTTSLPTKEVRSWEDGKSKFKLMKGIPGIEPDIPLDREKTCPNCRYTSDHAKNPYVSHCQLFRLVGARGLWTIGSEYFLKEEPIGLYPDGDAPTVELLRAFTTVPVVTDMISWTDGESKFSFTKRAPGRPLSELRIFAEDDNRISVEDDNRIGDELCEYMRQVRQFTSPVPMTVDGKRIYDNIFTHSSGQKLSLPSTIDEFRDQLRDRLIAGGKHAPHSIRAFQRDFPKERGRFVLTHGDLHPSNIIIHNGHISAILDWEHAGYYPVWWEYANEAYLSKADRGIYSAIGVYPDACRFCATWMGKFDMGTRYIPERSIFCSKW